MRRLALLLALTLLAQAGAAPKPPKAPADPLAELARRLDATPGESLARLAKELRDSPEASVRLLIQALEAWGEEGEMPEPFLRSTNLAYGCTRYAKVFLLLPQVTGLPLVTLDTQHRDPDATTDGAQTWIQWWKHYGSLKPAGDWAGDREGQARQWLKYSENMHGDAAVILSALGSDDAPSLVQGCFASSKTHEVQKGCIAAGLLGGRAFRRQVEESLRHASPLVQEAAARAAARLEDPSSVPPLRELAGKPARATRAAALKALLQLGAQDAADPLCQDLRASEAAVRGAALQALTALPKSAFRERVAAAAGEAQGEAALEFAAVRLLLGEKEALAALLEGVQSPEGTIQLKTVRLLLQAGGTEGRSLVAKDLEHYVNLAIGDGVEAMKQPPLAIQKQTCYGYRALRTYTLLKCHVPASELAADLDTLAKGPDDDASLVYGLSVGLMALDAAGRSGDVPRVALLAERLASLQNADGTWWYGGAKMANTADHSNTQFALLGLRAAATTLKRLPGGYRIPKELWQRSWDHFVSDQQVPKGSYAGGWGYSSGSRAYGSMTCAGVCSLLICHAQLHEPGKGRRKGAKPDFERLPPVAAGLAWLDDYFRISSNPESGSWLYYYLYSIERTGDLAGVGEFGGRDWYREGALYLLRNAHASGGWGENSPSDTLQDTAFALLFLRRATRSLYDVGETPR